MSRQPTAEDLECLSCFIKSTALVVVAKDKKKHQKGAGALSSADDDATGSNISAISSGEDVDVSLEDESNKRRRRQSSTRRSTTSATKMSRETDEDYLQDDVQRRAVGDEDDDDGMDDEEVEEDQTLTTKKACNAILEALAFAAACYQGTVADAHDRATGTACQDDLNVEEVGLSALADPRRYFAGKKQRLIQLRHRVTWNLSLLRGEDEEFGFSLATSAPSAPPSPTPANTVVPSPHQQGNASNQQKQQLNGDEPRSPPSPPCSSDAGTPAPKSQQRRRSSFEGPLASDEKKFSAAAVAVAAVGVNNRTISPPPPPPVAPSQSFVLFIDAAEALVRWVDCTLEMLRSTQDDVNISSDHLDALSQTSPSAMTGFQHHNLSTGSPATSPSGSQHNHHHPHSRHHHPHTRQHHHHRNDGDIDHAEQGGSCDDEQVGSPDGGRALADSEMLRFSPLKNYNERPDGEDDVEDEEMRMENRELIHSSDGRFLSLIDTGEHQQGAKGSRGGAARSTVRGVPPTATTHLQNVNQDRPKIVHDVSHIYRRLQDKAMPFFEDPSFTFDPRLSRKILAPVHYKPLRALIVEVDKELRRLRGIETILSGELSATSSPTSQQSGGGVMTETGVVQTPNTAAERHQQARMAAHTQSAVVFYPRIAEFQFLRDSLHIHLSSSVTEDEVTSLTYFRLVFEQYERELRDLSVRLCSACEDERARVAHSEPFTADDKEATRILLHNFSEVRAKISTLKQTLMRDMKIKNKTHALAFNDDGSLLQDDEYDDEGELSLRAQRRRMIDAVGASCGSRASITTSMPRANNNTTATDQRRRQQPPEPQPQAGLVSFLFGKLLSVVTCSAENPNVCANPSAPASDSNGGHLQRSRSSQQHEQLAQQQHPRRVSPLYEQKKQLLELVNRLWASSEAVADLLETVFPDMYAKNWRSQISHAAGKVFGTLEKVSVVFGGGRGGGGAVVPAAYAGAATALHDSSRE